MRVSRIRAIGLLAMAALAVSASGQGRLWIVSQSNCPRVDFATVQEAIDAAADGDVILLREPRPGSAYGSFTVDSKALAIVGDGRGEVAVSGTIALRNLAAHQVVLLRGIHNESHGADLDLDDNAGTVWIEDCDFGAGDGTRVEDCSALILTRSSLESKDDVAGLLAKESAVYLYETTVIAGPESGEEPGPAGVSARSGSVFLSGCSAVGGMGGFESAWQVGFGCLNGFPGGPGIRVVKPASAWILDSVLEGGIGGLDGCYMYSFGPRSPPTAGNGVLTTIAGATRRLSSNAPVIEGHAVPVTLSGQPGDVAALLVSLAPQPIFLPAWRGVVAPQQPGWVPVAGVIPTSGSLRAVMDVPRGLLAPNEAAVLYGQGLFLSTQGEGFLGATWAWPVLGNDHDPWDGCDGPR